MRQQHAHARLQLLHRNQDISQLHKFSLLSLIAPLQAGYEHNRKTSTFTGAHTHLEKFCARDFSSNFLTQSNTVAYQASRQPRLPPFWGWTGCCCGYPPCQNEDEKKRHNMTRINRNFFKATSLRRKRMLQNTIFVKTTGTDGSYHAYTRGCPPAEEGIPAVDTLAAAGSPAEDIRLAGRLGSLQSYTTSGEPKMKGSCSGSNVLRTLEQTNLPIPILIKPRQHVIYLCSILVSFKRHNNNTK